MNQILDSYLDRLVVENLDDIVMYNNSMEEYV